MAKIGNKKFNSAWQRSVENASQLEVKKINLPTFEKNFSLH